MIARADAAAGPSTAPSPTGNRSSLLRVLRRELRLLLRQRSAALALLALALVASAAVAAGLLETARQTTAIERFQVQDALERREALTAVSDWGGAAYAAFHATWDAPEALAFAAMGQRDVRPWMLRVRALALEGQIHESDAANPEIALAGRLDLAFVLAYLVPLILVLLLHDVIAGEQEAGRRALLVVTAGHAGRLWSARIAVRVGAIAVAVLVPFLIGAMAAGAGPGLIALGSAAVLASVLLWSIPILALSFVPMPSTVIASLGVLLWALLALLVPAAGGVLIDTRVAPAEGADVAFVQREAVNDAWDLPKAATMDRFYASYPQWADSTPVEQPFHWKWYYAFQQVGDETAAPLSSAYREAIAERDRLAGHLAWLSPAIFSQRALQRIAHTDVQASLAFDARVRAFHGSLRAFYYPLLFRDEPFDPAHLEQLPTFPEVLTR